MSGQYAIEFLASAARELEALPREVQGRLLDAIVALSADPRPSGVQLLAGTGRERIWRLRVGAFRVLYLIEDAKVTIVIVRVADRREAYTQASIKRLLGRLRRRR